MKIILTSVLFLSLSFSSQAQQKQFTNSGNFQMHPGANVTFFGDFMNHGTFTDNGSMAAMVSGFQQILGGSSSTIFNSLTLNNSSATIPQIKLGADIGVKQTLVMTSGHVNLNSRTVTVGTSGSSAGSLDYTAGSLYNGALTRWFSAGILAQGDEPRGLYPLGTSTGDFRPAWIGWNSALSAEGTVTITHNEDYSPSLIPASHMDMTWAGGTQVLGVTRSNWVFSSANDFAFNGASGEVRYGGEGYGPFILTDLNASLVSSVVGNFSGATNTLTILEVNRKNLNTAELTNDWAIGTRDPVNSSLPLTLISFMVYCGNQALHIEWTTLNEIGIDYFLIQKSRDGINWQVYDSLDATGTPGAYAGYHFTDTEPPSGSWFYRLVHFETDKRMVIYAAVHSDNCDGAPNLEIFPNPSPGVIQLVFYGLAKFLSLEIHNSFGGIVYRTSEFPSEIDMSSQPSGLYYLLIHFEGQNITRKFAIQR